MVLFVVVGDWGVARMRFSVVAGWLGPGQHVWVKVDCCGLFVFCCFVVCYLRCEGFIVVLW